MPTGRKYDFILNHNGYILARPKGGARAWARTGLPDTPAVEQPRLSAEYGGLPPQVEYPEVWVDWSGGYGYAYRHPRDENSYFGFLANPNTYHWSENFDARFERQIVHTQKLQTGPGNMFGIEAFMDSPYPRGTSTSVLVQANGTNGMGFAQSNVYFLVPNGSTNQYDIIAAAQSATGVQNRFMYRPAIFGSYHYIPSTSVQSGFGFFAVPMDGGNATQAALQGQCFEVAGNRLWRAIGNGVGGPTSLQSVADSSLSGVFGSGNWSATLNIGDNFTPILDMVELDDQLYVGKPTGLYQGDQGGSFFNVLADLSSQVHPDNCRDLAIFSHQVITPHIGGLFAFRPSTTTPSSRLIGPIIASNKSPVHGYPRCVKGFGGWLYAGYYNGSYSYILAGYDPATGEPYIWHPMQKIPAPARIHRLHFDGVSNASTGQHLPNRMWVSADSSLPDATATSAVWLCPIPLLNQNPLLPSDIGFTANYANSARMDLGNTDGRSPSTPKVYRKVEVWADNLDGSQRWGLIYYTLNDSGQRTLLGTINTSPKSVLYFPQGDPATGGSFVMGQSIELSLESYIAGGAEATSPVYRGIVLRQTQAPLSVDVITAIIDVGDNQVDRQGSKMRPGLNQLKELRGLEGTGPVQLTDLVGDTSWVKVLAPVEEQEQWQEGMDMPSVLATIKMAVMTFTGG